MRERERESRLGSLRRLRGGQGILQSGAAGCTLEPLTTNNSYIRRPLQGGGRFAGFGAFGGSRRFCRFRRFGIPIFMHSLGDVWHPGSGVPCFAAFAAFGGSQSHFLPYIFPIFMHSLGDVWHPGSGVPCFGSFCGGSQSHFLPYIFPILLHSLHISSLSSCIP